MPLPLGNSFLMTYRTDDVVNHFMRGDDLSYNSAIPVFAPLDFPPLSWRIVPRHWVAQYDGIEGSFLVRVICPIPFPELTQPDQRQIVTNNGFVLNVVRRVGEEWNIYDRH
jgi:hypothetical protein